MMLLTGDCSGGFDSFWEDRMSKRSGMQREKSEASSGLGAVRLNNNFRVSIIAMSLMGGTTSLVGSEYLLACPATFYIVVSIQSDPTWLYRQVHVPDICSELHPASEQAP